MRLIVTAALIAAFSSACAEETEDLGEHAVAVKTPDIKPNGRGIGTVQKYAKGHGGGGGANGIDYHGGPVMTGTKRIYLIWYGNWAGNTATTILPDLTNALGGSPYFNINSTYTNAAGQKVTNDVVLGGQTTDNYSKGTALTDANIQQIVTAAIAGGTLGTADASGIYFVLTSADVNATSGFCTQYCGWHTNARIGNVDVKYAFVGNPARCPSACENGTASPNGNAGADGMASIFAHELEEAATDPDLNAWYDRRGAENADKCAWTFGTTYTTANGGVANVKLGARDYLIQQNWVNAAGGSCKMAY